MACGCNNRQNKTNAQLRREARRAERQAEKQADGEKAKEDQDVKVPAPSNG